MVRIDLNNPTARQILALKPISKAESVDMDLIRRHRLPMDIVNSLLCTPCKYEDAEGTHQFWLLDNTEYRGGEFVRARVNPSAVPIIKKVIDEYIQDDTLRPFHRLTLHQHKPDAQGKGR